jgi:serine protease Do
VGFAIPSDLAKGVMNSLIKSGKVIRGWLGVSIQPVTPEIAKQFGLKEEKGALVGDVTEDSPAEKAGIQRGEVIIEYDGKEVADPAALRNMVAGTSPHRTVSIKIMSEGKLKTVNSTIGELPVSLPKISKAYDNLLKGIQVEDITPEMKKRLNMPKRMMGVIITDIAAGSPAESIFGQYDVILEINKNKIWSLKDYEKVVSKIKSGEDILVLIFREGSTIYITIPAQ